MTRLCAAIVLVLASAAEAQPPQIAVVVSSQRDPTNAVAPAIAQQVRDALKATGLQVLGQEEVTRRRGDFDPRSCDATPTCLSRLALRLDAVVVGVDASQVLRLVAGHLEAVGATSTTALALADLSADATRLNQDIAPAVARFARTLGDALQSPVAPAAPATPEAAQPPLPLALPAAVHPAADAPIEPALEPRAAPPLLLEASSPHRGRRVVAFSLGGAAVLTAAICIALAVLGGQSQQAVRSSTFDLNGQVASRLTQSQLEALKQTGDTHFTGSAISGAAAVALGASAAFLFTTE